MGRIDTLTAYRCEFRYIERNNPLREELKDKIYENNSPDYTVDEFIRDYIDSTETMAVGEESDRGIMLNCSDAQNDYIDANTNRWHIVPLSGKHGKEVTIYNQSTFSMNRFGSDSAALYKNHIFIYNRGCEIIAIFHRQNGSGCKTVFLETANNMLRNRGIKLVMNVIIPFDDPCDAEPVRLSLRYFRENQSTDAAENLHRKKRKPELIRNVDLYLGARENNIILNIINEFRSGNIDKDVAFAEIRREACVSEYDDAELHVKIGNRIKKVSLNDMNNALGAHDITEQMNSCENQSRNPIDVLTSLSDEYYYSIVREMEMG